MKQIYIAGSFSTDEEKDLLNKMIEKVKIDYPDYNLYIPMDHFVPGGNDKDENDNYIMPNDVWAKKVFDMDVNAIDNSEMIIALYRGRYSGTGTAWEIGYGYANKIPITLYVPDNTDTTSLMIVNSATNVISDNKFEQK